MKKEISIYLFRHGQSTFNRDGKFTGWKDPRLTELGIKQAKIVSRKLKSKKFGIAFHTRLIRSKQTLNEVLKFHAECKKIILDDRIIERNYGTLNGKTHESFIEKFGQEKYDSIHRGFNVPPPSGESFAMVEKRVKDFIGDLKKLIRKEQTNVAISAHGNSIRLFRKIMENASTEKTVNWVIPYDDFYEYKLKV